MFNVEVYLQGISPFFYCGDFGCGDYGIVGLWDCGIVGLWRGQGGENQEK